MRAFADAVHGDRIALALQADAAHAQPIALDTIKVPTLLFAGSEDVLAVRPEVLAQAIPGAELLVVPGDHLTALSAPSLRERLISFLAS